MQIRLNKLRELKDGIFQIQDETTLREQIRELALREKIVVQTIQQAEDFEYQIRNLYPYVLAYPYRVLGSITQAAQQYHEQLRVAENIMAFLGSVGFALLIHTGRFTSDEAQWLNEPKILDWWQNGINPGDWQEMGRRCLQLLRDSELKAASDFASIWFRERGSKQSEFTAHLRELGELLNDYKHGRGPKTPPQYDSGIVKVDSLLSSCLRDLSFTTQYNIHLVAESRTDWKTKQLVVKTLVHMGDHPGHRQQETVLNMQPPIDHLHLAANDQEWISLYPLISVHYCPSCEAREAYLIDRWDGFGGRLVLKSFERGHTLETSENHQAAMRFREDFEHFVRQGV